MSAAKERSTRAESPKPVGPADGSKSDKKNEDEKTAPKGGFMSPKTAGIVAAVAIVGFGLYKVVGDKVDVKGLMKQGIDFIEAQGDNGFYFYLALTLVGVVCLIPTTPMELAGGFLFSPKYGMWWVLFYTGSAKLIANTISVFMARNFFREWVMENYIAKNELLSLVSNAVEDSPWTMAFLVRGSMVPLAVKNYGLGVMKIGYLPIAVCSTIFTNFYAFQNIYMGSTLQNLADVFAPKKASDQGDWTATAKKLLPVVFNVLIVVVLVYNVKKQIKMQRAKLEGDLKKKSGSDGSSKETKKDS